MAIGDSIGGGSVSSGTGTGYSKNGKKLGRPPGSGKSGGIGSLLGNSSGRDFRKASVYLAGDFRSQIEAEAARLDRSTSYMISLAWKLAAEQIAALQSLPDSE